MTRFILSLFFLSLSAIPIICQTKEELYETALIYEIGNDSIKADSQKASVYYKLAAEKGNIEAQNYLGFRYYNGEGIRQDADSAIYWIRKAAEKGDIKAAGNMGYLLSQAPDITHDYDEAFRWLKTATEAGLPTAMTQLAELYRRGLGCSPDTLNAIRLYEKAISMRQRDGELRLLAMMGPKWKTLPADSAFILGLKYYREGAPIAAVELLENAASQGIIRAKALLGDAYSKGNGVAYDHDKSILLFYEAALEGDPSSQFILAELLEFFPDSFKELNLELPTDQPFIDEPSYWYEKAFLQGVTDAEEAFNRLFSQ